MRVNVCVCNAFEGGKSSWTLCLLKILADWSTWHRPTNPLTSTVLQVTPYLQILDSGHAPHSVELPTAHRPANPLAFVHAQDTTWTQHHTLQSFQLCCLNNEYSHIWLDPTVLHKASGQLTSDFCSGSRCLKILDIGPHFAWISAQLTRRNKQHGNAQRFWPTNPWLHTFVQAQVTLAWKSTLTGHCCSGHCTTASNFAKVLQQ